MPDTHWPDYYAATVDRPAWGTTIDAAERFAAQVGPEAPPLLAVDLGCGAGRDTRELLRRGWRVLAVDAEAAAIEAVKAATPKPIVCASRASSPTSRLSRCPRATWWWRA